MKKINVTLLMAHRHEDQQKNAGDVLSVDIDIANWLIQRNIAMLPDEAATNNNKGEKQ